MTGVLNYYFYSNGQFSNFFKRLKSNSAKLTEVMKYKKCAYLEYLYHLWFISVAKKLTETKQ